MDTLYNDMCNTLSCQSCDLTLIALFYFKNNFFLVLSTAKTKKKKKKRKKNKRKKKRFFHIFILASFPTCEFLPLPLALFINHEEKHTENIVEVSMEDEFDTGASPKRTGAGYGRESLHFSLSQKR